MKLVEYQQEAFRTASREGTLERRRLIAALGLAGEVGEVAELVKKEIGHGHTLPRDRLAKELGDTLWYVATVASLYDLDLGVIATENIAKLRRRYPDGFKSEDSIARRDLRHDGEG